YSVQSSVRRINDHSRQIPSASSRIKCIGEYFGALQPGQVDCFQLSLGKESKRASIRRPKRKRATVGTGYCLELQRIQLSNRDDRATSFGQGHVGKALGIWGHRQVVNRRDREVGPTVLDPDCRVYLEPYDASFGRWKRP